MRTSITTQLTTSTEDFEENVCDTESDSDYYACRFAKQIQIAKRAHVEVFVVIDDYLLRHIRQLWKNRLCVKKDEQSDIKDLADLTFAEQSELESSVIWYVKKFLSSVNIKFEKDFPRIKFHIAWIKYNDPNFMKQFIPTDSVKHRSPEFDVARTKVKMQTLFALEKSDNTDFDVV